MSYAETLERLKKIQETPHTGLTKPTKAPSVSFVSTPPDKSENFPAMPTRPELEAICRRACSGFNVEPDHLLAFLIEAEDPAWTTEKVARHLARRMSEGLL